MSVFTAEEIDYLLSQRHGHLATVGSGGGPHVVPVAYRYDPEADAIDIGGPVISRTKKFRDVRATPQVAFVVDDILPPWRPRGIEIRGRAQIMSGGGDRIFEGFEPEVIRITPERIAVWGVEAEGVRSTRAVGATATGRHPE